MKLPLLAVIISAKEITVQTGLFRLFWIIVKRSGRENDFVAQLRKEWGIDSQLTSVNSALRKPSYDNSFYNNGLIAKNFRLTQNSQADINRVDVAD